MTATRTTCRKHFSLSAYMTVMHTQRSDFCSQRFCPMHLIHAWSGAGRRQQQQRQLEWECPPQYRQQCESDQTPLIVSSSLPAHSHSSPALLTVAMVLYACMQSTMTSEYERRNQSSEAWSYMQMCVKSRLLRSGKTRCLSVFGIAYRMACNNMCNLVAKNSCKLSLHCRPLQQFQ